MKIISKVIPDPLPQEAIDAIENAEYYKEEGYEGLSYEQQLDLIDGYLAGIYSILKRRYDSGES